MRIFKKVIASFSIFCILTVLLTFCFANAYFESCQDFALDRKYRDNLSGTLDALIIGSSEGATSLIPKIIDSKLHLHSYNLSTPMITPNGKIKLIEEEINRNSISTVFIVVGSDINFHQEYKDLSECDLYVIQRLNTINGISYFFKNVKTEKYLYYTTYYLKKGFEVIRNKIMNVDIKVINEDDKGFHYTESKNKKDTDNLILKNYQRKRMSLGSSEDIDLFEQLIELCKLNNIKVYLIKPTLPENTIWCYSNLDEVNKVYKTVAEKYNCPYFDFNLLKERTECFDIERSFLDGGHLSGLGAQQFTKLVCDTIKKTEKGEDVSDMFYSSYDEAIKHFEYYEIYQSMIKEQS